MKNKVTLTLNSRKTSILKMENKRRKIKIKATNKMKVKKFKEKYQIANQNNKKLMKKAGLIFNPQVPLIKKNKR